MFDEVGGLTKVTSLLAIKVSSDQLDWPDQRFRLNQCNWTGLGDSPGR